MINNKTILAVSSIFILGSCSSVSNVFNKKEAAPLEGERISVLELQKTLSPDRPLEAGQGFDLPAPWKNTAWPQAGGYPNHSMQNLSLSSEKLKSLWTADIGQGSTKNLPLTAAPIIIGNTVYTLDTDATLSAFNAQNGKKIWHADVSNANEDEAVISGGISFAHDTLYVTNGYDEVLAVSAENGSVLWRKRLPAPSRSAPTALDGRLFVSTIDNRLVALNAKDGTGLWEYTAIGETTGLLGAASPAANREVVVPTFSSGEITALRVDNGSVSWSDNLANVRHNGGGLESLADIKAMPVIDQGVIVAISFGGKLAAIDERTGARIWQRDISGAQTPWITGNLVFVISAENQIIALSLIDGSIFWIEQLPQFKDEKNKDTPIRWTGPLMASNRLITVGSNGVIAEIDPHNGKITRTTNTKKVVQIPPVISNNMLYILTEDGSLIAYQ